MSSELSKNFTSLYSCLQLLPSHSSSRSLLPVISICVILHPLIEVFRLILWLCINLQCVIENVLTCLNADKSLTNSFEGINVHQILNSSTILSEILAKNLQSEIPSGIETRWLLKFKEPILAGYSTLWCPNSFGLGLKFQNILSLEL
ncbi:unnamed protein product [Moneuplotes crassus]|uniref:Uncharacterized protein n=1 Tax=Euplotes crassus TaxID=5936 RepID=A0AAD1XVS0_EUPCR|nr:unnamed protein product [Moneuplotes crassus]